MINQKLAFRGFFLSLKLFIKLQGTQVLQGLAAQLKAMAAYRLVKTACCLWGFKALHPNNDILRRRKLKLTVYQLKKKKKPLTLNDRAGICVLCSCNTQIDYTF